MFYVSFNFVLIENQIIIVSTCIINELSCKLFEKKLALKNRVYVDVSMPEMISFSSFVSGEAHAFARFFVK